MDFNTFQEAVRREAEALGLSEYELYYESGESTSISAFQHEVSDFTSSAEGGVCFRCVVNGKMGYASTEALSGEEARALVRRAADNAASLESDDPAFLCPGGKEYEELRRQDYPLPTTEELRRVLLDAQEKLYAADARVVDGCESQVFSEKRRLAIVNSRGLDLRYENALSGLLSSAVVKEGEEMANAYEIKVGELGGLDIAAVAGKAAEKAVRKLGGEVAPTAVCPVVFSPEAMADLLSTFCGIFSAENTQKGLSLLAGREGERIASGAVTLVDDPFYPENPMPMPFDAEGCPTRRKNVIEAGVLRTLLYNMKTAAVAGRETTGNASKAGYALPVAVRPFTMYLAPGTDTEEALLKKAEGGVFINSLAGLHAGANTISGDFSLQSAGFLIRGGKKSTYVKSFTVAGNFYDMLRKITALSDKVVLPSAMGKTAFGSPCVLVESLSIAGK